MNLVIDWGNSSLKTGWFEGDRLLETKRFESPQTLLAYMAGRSDYHPTEVLVSSTSRPADEMRAGLAGLSRDVRVLTAQTPVPIGKDYDTPHTLGADRVAAAVGATVLYPGRYCLILDLGTCLTADWVDRDGIFRGGLISPGLRMRFRAMHEQTARLPLVETPADWPALTARNTRQAMQAGVMNGLACELNGIIDHYRQQQPDAVVLLCGGDAPAFESRLKPSIFAVPELVLIGLNRILRYNVENLHADTPDTNH